MNNPPPPRHRLGRLLGSVLALLGWPVWRLYRALGVGAKPPAPPAPAPELHAPPLTLPVDWTRPREMNEVKPTLAPVTLAFGLSVLALGMLVMSLATMILGGLLALIGAGLWAWDAWQETA